MPCKHAELAAIYAQQMAEMDEPWLLWNRKRPEWQHWDRCDSPFAFLDSWEYRQIPKTININGHEVPEPMREKPEIGTEYWYVDAKLDNGASSFYWDNGRIDNLLLSHGK